MGEVGGSEYEKIGKNIHCYNVLYLIRCAISLYQIY